MINTRVNEEDRPLAYDKIVEIKDWLKGVEVELHMDRISYGELVEIDHVYEALKEVL